MRLCYLSFYYIEYCNLSELRVVLEHPEHPLWRVGQPISIIVFVHNLLDQRFPDSPLRAEIVKRTICMNYVYDSV